MKRLDYLISVSMNELLIYLIDRKTTKHGFILFHQNNQKQRKKNQKASYQISSLLLSSSWFLSPTIYHYFLQTFFLHPLSPLCTISMYMFVRYCTWRETFRPAHLWKTGSVSQQHSVANSYLVMEDFLNLPMLRFCPGWPCTSLVCPHTHAVMSCVQQALTAQNTLLRCSNPLPLTLVSLLLSFTTCHQLSARC